MHPIAPIYDLARNELTPRCAAVMKRIFRFFDSDCDGMLSAAELNRFQVFCFDVALDEEEMVSLRKVRKEERTKRRVSSLRSLGRDSIASGRIDRSHP